MRLVCPNCDAEYEVDAAVIPENGRDVQCSNCGHAWFQLPPEVEAEMAAEEALYEAPPAVFAAAHVSEPEAEPVRAAAVEPEPVRRSIDESVLAVLREEAEREVEARKVETPVVETQPDLGLEAPAEQGMVARRLARLKGEPEAAAKPQTRREMLPEIEEINSTLRASSEKRAGEAAAVADTMQPAKTKGAGFRNGFSLMLLLAVLLLVAYVMAPELSQQIPALAGPLKAYVAMVDQARLALDGLLRAATGLLHGATGETG